MQRSKCLLQRFGGFLALPCLISSLVGEPQGKNRVTVQRNKRIEASAVNDARLGPTLTAGDTGSAPLRAQILLDRLGFSVGEIDGRIGKNTFRAVSGLRAVRGWAESEMLDEPIWMVLNADSAPVLISYTIAAADLKGPFTKVPKDMMAKARLPHLGYSTALEGLSEKFHCSPMVLRALNPKSRFSKPGEQITVPHVRSPMAMKAARIVVSKAESTLAVFDSNGRLIAQYPCTSGSEHDPLPMGEWTVRAILKNPHFNYNPDLFWDADPAHTKARIAPGPNNPVGVAWIDLSKEHYGIHGTPEPSTIGYAESHGCIRLTNWDASELAGMVVAGIPVLLKE